MLGAIVPFVPRGPPSARCRIGPEKYHYEYTQIEPRLWQCSRGSDWAANGHKLFLVFDDNEQWTAYDAPAAGVASQGRPIFRTGEDWTQPGWHAWVANLNAGSDAAPSWRDGGQFLTTILL